MIGAKPSVSQQIYVLEMCHGATNQYRAAHICANLQWNAAEPTEPSPQSLCAMCKVQSARVKSRLIFGKAGQHKISLLSAPSMVAKFKGHSEKQGQHDRRYL